MSNFIHFAKNFEREVLAVSIAVGVQKLWDHYFELWDKFIPAIGFCDESRHIVASCDPYLSFLVPNRMNK